MVGHLGCCAMILAMPATTKELAIFSKMWLENEHSWMCYRLACCHAFLGAGAASSKARNIDIR